MRCLPLLFCLLALPAWAIQDAADPWEQWNRKVFVFNETLDTYFMKPVAEGYDKLTPRPVSQGVTRFFSNISELPTSGNALLQGKPSNSGKALLRFLINSTVGIFGIFDVASALGVEQQKEDFAQTLAVWGVPSGNYLVLPFFGPSTVRESFGLAVDVYVDPVNIDDVAVRNSLWALKIVDARAELLKVESLVSGDRYVFMRSAYLQRRAYLIHDGRVDDDFDTGDFDDDDDWMMD